MPAASLPAPLLQRFLPARLSRSWVFIGWLSLGGCSLVPAYHSPQLAVAPAWDGVQPGATAIDTAAAQGGAWWEEFHNQELDGLIARGIDQNYTLKAAISRVDEAQSLAQVTGAAQYPQLSLGGNYQHEDNYGTTKKRSVSAQASYEVDFWGKARAAADSSTALANASGFDAQALRMTLDATIANTYFQVLSLDDRLGLARSIADAAQRLADVPGCRAGAAPATRCGVVSACGAGRCCAAGVHGQPERFAEPCCASTAHWSSNRFAAPASGCPGGGSAVASGQLRCGRCPCRVLAQPVD